MKIKKKNLLLFIASMVLVGIIYAVCHFFYTSHICPIWDIQNKVCYSCDHPNLVWVNPSIPNHCPQRQILEDCCKDGYYRSIPKGYVDKNHILDCEYRAKYVWDDCMVLNRTIVTFVNLRSMIFVSGGILALVFLAIKKTRWSGFCIISALGALSCVGEIIDYVTSWADQFEHIDVLIISGLVAVLPCGVSILRFFRKKITRRKLLKNLLVWFLILCIPFLILSLAFL